MRIRRLFRKHRQSEEGAVTVEAAIWLPFFILMTVAIGDVALIFHAQTRAHEVAEEGIRLYSTGGLASPADTSQWIVNAITNISPNATASTSVNFGLVNTEVSLPIADINGFGIFSALTNFTLRVNTQQVMEFAG